jgi:hypothetical protein
MTVSGTAKEVVVYVSPTGSDADGLALAGAELAAGEALRLGLSEPLGLVDEPVHAVAPTKISTADATKPRPSRITGALPSVLRMSI